MIIGTIDSVGNRAIDLFKIYLLQIFKHFREFFLGIVVIGKDGALDKEEALRLVFRLYDTENR